MGGSGGGGGPYYDVKPSELAKRAVESSEELADGFLPQLERIISHKLADFIGRDTDLTNQRRDEIKRALADVLRTAFDLQYGGSVAKHTEVNGLSDVDLLLIMRDRNAGQLRPGMILDRVATKLRRSIVDAEVSTGRIAITVHYPDGMEIQLVPAARAERGYKVPSWDGERWSRINPRTFRKALTRRNNQCNGNLIPVIKLAKAIISDWPARVRLTGYHVESLAIDAFKGYSGTKTVAKMLPAFFEKATKSVLSPIRDSTGQSVNVDSYLGRSQSEIRRKASHWCSQTAKRMKQASLQGSRSQWEEMFE